MPLAELAEIGVGRYIKRGVVVSILIFREIRNMLCGQPIKNPKKRISVKKYFYNNKQYIVCYYFILAKCQHTYI